MTAAMLSLLIALVGYSALQQASDLRAAVRNNSWQEASQVAAEIDGFLSSTDYLLTTLSAQPAIKQQDPEAATPMLDELLRQHPSFVNIWATRADGWNWASPLPPPDGKHIYIGDREYFKQAVRGDGLAVQSVPDSRQHSTKFAVAMSRAVRGADGQINGTVTAGFELLSLDDVLHHASLPPGSVVTILDDDGYVIARSSEPERWVGFNAKGTDLWSALRESDGGVFTGPGFDGTDHLKGYASVQRAPWKVLVGTPPSVAYAALWEAIARQLLLLAIPGLVVGYLAVRLGRTVVEKERAREAIQRQQELLEKLVSSASVGIAVVRGPEHRFELINPRYQGIPGTDDEPMIGRTFAEVFPKVAEQVAIPMLEEVYRTGKTVSVREFEASVGRGREQTYWNVDHVPLRGPDGSVAEVLILAQEITEQVLTRKRVEELAAQVRLERAHLEAVLRQMPAGVVIAEAPSGKLILGNEEVARIWRHPFSPSIEEAEDREYTGFHPDGSPYKREEWPLVRSIFAGEVVTNEQIEILRGDGTRGTISASSSPVRHDGHIAAGVLVLRDITERKRVEEERTHFLEQLRMVNQSLTVASLQAQSQKEEADRRAAELDAVVRSVADGLVMYDASGKAIYSNPAADRILGYSRYQQESIEERAKLLRVETAEGEPFPAESTPTERALRGETVHGVTLVLHPTPETTCWLAASAAPIRSGDGTLLGVVSTFTDITAQHDIQAQLEQNHKRMEEFIHMVAHDLRNPLTSVGGQAQWLRRLLTQKGLERESQSAEAIITSAGRMEAMLRDLVETTRLESGQLHLDKHPADLFGLLVSITERIGTLEDRARIRLEPPDQLLQVPVDHDRIERVIVNLITNGLKYSGPESPVVVRLAQRDGEAVVSVADGGIGVSAEELPRLFERGYRAAGATRAEGLGLGLYITRLLIEAHDGRVWAESTPGKGSTFHFSLPLA